MATKKKSDPVYDIEIYRAQMVTALVQARAIARELFGDSAEVADPKLALRIVDFLEFEDNGDPAESQKAVVAALKESKRLAEEVFGHTVSEPAPSTILDVHELTFEDFFGDGDE